MFRPLVDAFAGALAEDDMLAVKILTNATAIVEKRERWAVRLRFRELSELKKSSYEPTCWKLADAVAVFELHQPLNPLDLRSH